LRVVLAIAAAIGLLGWRARLVRLRKPGEPQAELRIPLRLSVAGHSFWRWQLVPVTLRVYGPDGRPTHLPKRPLLKVLRGGKPVTTVADVEAIELCYDHKAKQYKAYWPPPWAAEPGEYVAEVRCRLRDPEKWQWGPWKPRISDEAVCEAVAVARFRLRKRKPRQIEKPICAVTWEPHLPEGRLLAPDGRRTNWRALVQWAEYMGADTLWCRGAITEVSRKWTLSMDQPFAPLNTELLHRIASEAHRKHIRFGVWAVAYATLPHGRNAGKPPYMFAKIICPDGSVGEHDFISLLDPDRPDHLARWLHWAAGLDGVDMVGLDYMRPDRGDYQITDIFAEKMPVELPAGWRKWDKLRRWRWIAKMVERRWRYEPRFYETWNWFRCHLVAARVNEISKKAGLQKPLWCFVFGWQRGQQSGQDPVMLFDAGADALAVMLYQSPSVEHFEHIVRQWREYSGSTAGPLIPGDQVDDFWHQRLRRPAAPQELYRRIVKAFKYCAGGNPCAGAFWHDISRALMGRIGPYPSREWALAGAAAFTEVRRICRAQPIELSLRAPKRVHAGINFTCKLTLRNRADVSIRDIRISVERTRQVQAVSQSPVTVPELAAGAELTLPVRLRITALDPRRANRFMIALRVTWPRGDYGPEFPKHVPPVAVCMKYVDAF